MKCYTFQLQYLCFSSLSIGGIIKDNNASLSSDVNQD